MSFPQSLRRLFQPSLGKVGLAGIALSLALLAYAPTVPGPQPESVATQAESTPVAVQVKTFNRPRG
jgi:hypothetical protein